MLLPNINPTKTKSWQALEKHFQEIKSSQMQNVFEEDKDRTDRMKIEWQDFYLDYSKNRLTDQTISLLLNLAFSNNLLGSELISLKIEPSFIRRFGISIP